MIEATIPVGSADELVMLLGASDQHLRRIRDSVPAKISARDGKIHVSGDEQAVLQATEIIEQIKTTVTRDGALSPEQVNHIIKQVTGGPTNGRSAPVDVKQAGKIIRPRTGGQAEYVEAIRTHDLVFCSGPAGTGKTYLAVATAVESLKQKQIGKIVLVRPAVEAGENLGFLPGDMQAKINPYLRPLYDALDEMMPFERVQRALEQRVIEVAPLAFMRGRTLADAFVIVDEAQNATAMQMKMLMTRLGVNSQMVITGDKTQVDLPKHEGSGLTQVERILPGIDGIGFHYFTEVDVVRHRLVRDIVRAYAADATE